jgi:hypothetical protein
MAQTRGHGKVFTARALFPRLLELRAGQTGGFFAARLLHRLLEML